MRELRTTPEVDEALAGSGLIFKHSNRCPVSHDAREEVERLMAARPDVAVHLIDVVASRPLSQHVAQVTGIVHQSPQAIVVCGGEVRWHGSHYAITAVALERHLPGPPGAAPAEPDAAPAQPTD